MTTDLDAGLGTTSYSYSVLVECEGAFSTTVTLSHDNPRFAPHAAELYLQCGTVNAFNFTFSPTEPGLTVDNLTFTSDLGTVEEQLIGNGVIIEQAEYWTAELGEGTSAMRLVYDWVRDLIYISDFGDDRLLILSPELRSVIATVAVGLDPAGLSMALDGQKLYVANSGEHSISVIDLNAWIELERVQIPTLYPNPNPGYQFEYKPYEIAVVSETLALLGSAPPGLASGGPIYRLDLQSWEVTPTQETPGSLWGAYPVFRTSGDYEVTGIVVYPASSPTLLARYATATDSFTVFSDGLERSVAVNSDGSRMVTTSNDANANRPNLAIYDADINKLPSIQLLGLQSLAAVFNPVKLDCIYAIESGEYTMRVEEARLDLGRQTRQLTYYAGPGYYHNSNSLVISPDAEWLYMPLVQTYLEPPSLLAAVRVGPLACFDLSPTYLPLVAKGN